MDSTSSNVIGTAKGPGEYAQEYVFVSSDRDRKIKAGEFVYYSAQVEGVDRQILGRVTRHIPVRAFPDAYMADPTIPPDRIAATVGFDELDYELFEITATVLGYYDPLLGDFVNPRVPPRAGTPIFICSDSALTAVLSKKQRQDSGSIHIGSLLGRNQDSVPIVLDARAITSTHMAIIASTGAGKSYLNGVVVEELMSPYNRAAVLVMDPHGEYNTLLKLTECPEFARDDYRPEVRILQPENVKVRISSLTLADMRYLLPNLSERMHWLLGRSFGSVRRDKGDNWTLDDLLIQVRHEENASRGGQEENADESDFGTAQALAWRLDATFGRSATFDNFKNLELRSLFRPGLCTVLQMNEIDEREQQVIVATLLRRVLKARMDTDKKRADAESDFYLPYPVFVILEEAQHFAPASADIISSQILKTILSEGRKFGIGIGLISQRPGRLDSDVLSQCMTQFIMRIVNPVDQARVAESVESVGRNLLDELPALSKGQVIVAGAAINTPVLARVRRRITPHGAEDPDAPARWLAYFDSASEEQRVRESALPAQKQRKRKDIFK